MTTTPDGIGRTGDAKDADSELDFGNSGRLEDTIRSQPSCGRPKREDLVSMKSMEAIEPRSCIEGLEVPMLFGLCNVLRTVLLGDKIAATVAI